MSRETPSTHIIWEFADGPWGGGNQFLKALKKQFLRKGQYQEDAARADVILFNGHQFQKRTMQLKRKYPDKIFVHRVDGPMTQTRGEAGVTTDRKIFACNSWIADGTVFQSEWSRRQSRLQGMIESRFETCIINAPDPELFHPSGEIIPRADERIRLIATSWSANPKKGFDILHHLDRHLNFGRYTMTFVGNSDAPFSNIETLAPQPSEKLADLLRAHDIFVAPSLVEACSNSFLEAMHCGLPAAARNNSSHPELLNGNGLLFEGTADILSTIDKIAANLEEYRSAPRNVLSIDMVAERYSAFMEQITRAANNKRYRPQRLSTTKYYLGRLILKKL